MAKFTMVLTPRDRHNMRRIMELTGVSKSEAVRRALEQHRGAVEDRIAAEATQAAALQTEAT
jgi:hypothetical protein